MWRIIIVAVLLGAAAGYRTSSSANVKPIAFTGRDDPAATTLSSTTANEASSPAPSLSTTTPQATTSTFLEYASSTKPSAQTLPVKEEETPLQEIGAEQPIDEFENSEANRRRVITYDQRQEGQYNIRADLENFMIVLIPPSPADGVNLLDLLTKSSLRRSSSSQASKAKGRPQYANGTPTQQSTAATRYQQSLKTVNNNQNFNYFNRPQGAAKGASAAESAHQRYHQQQQQSSDGSSHSTSLRFQEFIEGRTPYHVDITSSESEHSRLHPDRQVDVLPPPYPAYQHLIKPFHLDVEPTVIQALPPAALASQSSQGASNFLDTYNQLLAASSLQDSNDDGSSHTVSRAKLPQESDYYRVSRAIRADNLLDSNNVGLSNSLLGGAPEAVSMYRRSSHLPIFRSDLSFGTAALYPPIDVPRLTGYLNVGSNSRTLALNTAEERDLEDAHVGEIIVPAPSIDELDLDLNSASFLDSEAKSLLSDGLERCAPGRRRDSYGVCREIEGY